MAQAELGLEERKHPSEEGLPQDGLLKVPINCWPPDAAPQAASSAAGEPQQGFAQWRRVTPPLQLLQHQGRHQADGGDGHGGWGAGRGEAETTRPALSPALQVTYLSLLLSMLGSVVMTSPVWALTTLIVYL